ncbi:MAG: LysR substrate-binding domain-containing protein, partial [Pseudomonadota bacterium]
NIVFRSNSLQSQYQAVSDGMGLALLHGFLAAKDKNLKAVLVNTICISREYWMVVHEDMRQLSRINAVSSFFTEVIKKEQKRLLRTA